MKLNFSGIKDFCEVMKTLGAVGFSFIQGFFFILGLFTVEFLLVHISMHCTAVAICMLEHAQSASRPATKGQYSIILKKSLFDIIICENSRV